VGDVDMREVEHVLNQRGVGVRQVRREVDAVYILSP
jgi:hypothetical protein